MRPSPPIVWRLLAVLALGHLVWPLFHHFVLVRQLDIFPWRMGGYAMYAVTLRDPDLELFVDAPRRLAVPIRSAPQAVLQAYDRYFQCRHFYGRLCSADELAETFFAAQPQFESVEIIFSRRQLDPGTGLVRRTVDARICVPTTGCRPGPQP